MVLPFSETYLGKLRAVVGTRLLQVTGFRAILEDEQGRILLQLRSDFREWGFPGGHPEENESISDCVIREVREETGLSLRSFSSFGFSSDPHYEVIQYPNGDTIHTYAILVHATQWTGRLDEKNDESLELRFFAPEELPPLMQNCQRSLEMFFRYRETGQFQTG